ncbi:hypothetical protein KPL39_16890 [Clostridium gasigenes]|uniref:hypothetical protein n=1 Tax=Clostridium gasigenes TaxID=94869 RepID=UPI001C0B0446|nr:hypothetical protein [Clostridium gasigenes]MBU3137920.1 hypothetical protein [Clostridium gasigenes]
MKYLIAIVLLIVISFISILVTMSLINKDDKLKDNFKASSVFMVVTLPIISLVGGILFLIFKLIAVIMKLQASTFAIFIVAIAGAVSIFICDFITKKIMIGISTKYFANKYKNKELTEKEMMIILENKQKTFNIYSLVIMFCINMIIYFMVMIATSVDYTATFLIIISMISLFTYKVLFRKNITTGN